MYVYKPVTKDWVTTEVWEIKLCVGCCRMICLNHERYRRFWFINERCFVYKHEQCPPPKELKQLGV